MSIEIKIDDETKDLARQFPAAAQAVLNRTAASAKTLVAKELPKEYNVSAKMIKSRISVIKSTRQSLVAIVRFSQKRFAPILFANPQFPTTRRQAVLLEIKRGQKEMVDRKWFVQRGRKTGNLNVFTQEGKDRTNLTLMKWLTADKIFDMSKINPMITRFVETKLSAELPRVIESLYRAGR